MRHRIRSLNRLPDTQQRTLGLPATAAIVRPPVPPGAALDRFVGEVEPFLGERRVSEVLAAAGFRLPIVLRELVREQDFSAFIDVRATGRRPIHPRVFISLFVYGCLTKHTSLRELERLARIDLGGLFLGGGLQPDHSTIGKFIHAHRELLSGEFFVAVTSALGRKMGIQAGEASLDGTVMQAAASAYNAVKTEAAAEAAADLRRLAEAKPEDAALARRAETAQEAATVGALRESLREQRGRSPDAVRVSLSEPDAVCQPQKHGGAAPSYKPSVIAHESRLICGQAVDNCNETVVVSTLLDQHEAVLGANPTTLCLDAGYSNEQVFNTCIDRDINALIPSGREDAPAMEKGAASGRLQKQAFQYDEGQDAYRCPAGKLLLLKSREADMDGRPVGKYHSSAQDCAACPLRARCLKTGGTVRSILRYFGLDPQKEAMAKTLRHPLARQEFSRRKVTVEPIFSSLRHRQGLHRFLRRGLIGVRVEFALHCLAHNFGMAIRNAIARLLTLTLLLSLLRRARAAWVTEFRIASPIRYSLSRRAVGVRCAV